MSVSAAGTADAAPATAWEGTDRRPLLVFAPATAILLTMLGFHHLGEALAERSSERLSKATVQSTLRDLKAFFEWLARTYGRANRPAPGLAFDAGKLPKPKAVPANRGWVAEGHLA